MKSNKSNGQLTAQINVSDHKKSGFDLSNNVLGTGKIGRIIPTRALHVMPGDTIKSDSKVAVQFEPLAVPILANMDVKQEHFYVPYNIVWKNWDKFISGGEKLDYQGVVPNTSMRKIIEDVIGTVMPIEFNCAMKVEDSKTEFYFDRPNHWITLNPIKEFLDTLGDTYSIKDLLKSQYEALNLFTTLEDSAFNLEVSPAYYSGVPYFELITVNMQTDPKDALRAYYDAKGLSGNKYMEDCFDYIIQKSQNYQVVLPTPAGCSFLNLYYELYKNIVGYGSNLDYLNMNRMSLTEFYAMSIDLMTECYAQGFFGGGTDPLEAVPFGLGNMYQFVTDMPMSILHLRANYNIWYHNYRDILLEENAYEPQDGDVVSNQELFVLLLPRQRCWEKDAFTTALDNPGTGNVGVPLRNNLAYGTSNTFGVYNITGVNDLGSEGGRPILDSNLSNVAEITVDGESYKIPTLYLSGVNNLLENEGLQGLPGFSLYALDAAQRAQTFIQKALFYGNRINDFYNIRFGVRYLDARLRLPELLTSSSQLVRIDVLMNNTTTSESIAGDRAGFASAYDEGDNFDRFCEEHGVIMSYMTIMPQATYAYGMSRDYSRLDQFDFAFPEFATLGMDAVYDSEISNSCKQMDGIATSLVFGYQGKYYDYKAKHSEEHGELLDSQDMYTFARNFNMLDPDGRPKLNYEFVHCFPDLDMFVVDSPLADYFRYDIRHSTAAERELPVHSIYI